MIANTEDDMIDTLATILGSFDFMNVHMAEDLREDTEMPRETYKLASDSPAAPEITVIEDGNDIVVVTDRSPSVGVAWAGRGDSRDVIEELVNAGDLTASI